MVVCVPEWGCDWDAEAGRFERGIAIEEDIVREVR